MKKDAKMHQKKIGKMHAFNASKNIINTMGANAPNITIIINNKIKYKKIDAKKHQKKKKNE